MSRARAARIRTSATYCAGEMPKARRKRSANTVRDRALTAAICSTVHSRPGSESIALTTRSRNGSFDRDGQPCGAQPTLDQARITDCRRVVAIIRQMTRSPLRSQTDGASPPMWWASAAAAGSSSSKRRIQAVSGSSALRCAALSAHASRDTSTPEPAGMRRVSERSATSSASPARRSSGSPASVGVPMPPRSTYTRERPSRTTAWSVSGRMRCCERMLIATSPSIRSSASLDVEDVGVGRMLRTGLLMNRATRLRA